MAILNTPTFKIAPSSKKVQSRTNYTSVYDYSSVYDLEFHEEIAQIYGKQSVAGMLHMLGAESGFASDKYVWTEEGRLHTIYKNVTRAGNVFTQPNHVFRLNETVHISDGSIKRRGVIIAVDNDTFEVAPYKNAGFTALATTGIVAFVDGSEYKKGTGGAQGSLETDVTILDNSPIIEKDTYEVNGSDATNISWIETDEGGYLWYLQSEKDTRRRWEDRMELSMILGEKAEAGSVAEANGLKGTEGMLEAVRKRGNRFQGIASQLDDWDDILKRFDAQGKIQDYMHYVDRDQSLATDNLLGELNAGHPTGLSYGIFDNDKDMTVNLGFKGFTRGTYNFFKTDYSLLNDPTLLGGVTGGKIRGILIPVGTKEVYEGEYYGNGSYGDKITVPFLQQKYKVAGGENRKYKTWVTGSVGIDTPTNDEDVMTTHHLSERMLCTTGANNFMLFED